MTAGAALARLIARPGTDAGNAGDSGDAERCGLCAAPAEDEHRHLLDTTDGELLCACRACALLFTRDAAARGKHLLVPRRRVRLPGPPPGRELGVPVGLAFFVPHPDGTVLAHYPSPAGATRWELDPEVWRAAVCRRPALGTIRAGVEALLADTVPGGADQHWIVPVDDCFRLVGVVRQEWRGLSGGTRIRPAIARFFDELTPRE
ncbi:DUF5947 family protein [Streptomyces aidingensis]|uniref:Uncharacterized protein n=1 Tax=Streptomyces aidingensis TaxID=910347 RepID=A0A1I1V8A1_9ACTN|nr:DUF5947 family protein [Streptomyces aidingensis]SFD79242.1 hypothetical protein SAMN05421773_1319 [Streptomyces aidingensis]